MNKLIQILFLLMACSSNFGASQEKIMAMLYKTGCPGCDDGSVGTLKILTERAVYTHTFEGPDPPASIAEFTKLITAETFQE